MIQDIQDTSIKEQYKRLKGLERANPKVNKMHSMLLLLI